MSNEIEEEPLLDNASESSEDVFERPRVHTHSIRLPPTRDVPSVEARVPPIVGSSSQSADVGTSTQTDISALEGCTPPSSPDRPPPMLDYDVMGGVPVRTLKPVGYFLCHAFSDDGQLFATGTCKTIQIWRRTDYALVGKLQGIDVKQMSFVDRGSEILRVVEAQGNTSQSSSSSYFITDFHVNRKDKEGTPSAQWAAGNLSIIRRKAVPKSSGYNGTFSEDGNTLLIDMDDEKLAIFRCQGDDLLEQKILSPAETKFHCPHDPEYYHSHFLSPNGRSLFAVLDHDSPASHDASRRRIAVWPKLQFNADTAMEPVVLTGNRAVWTASGAYLAVWDQKEGKPRLSVYAIEDLNNGDVHPCAIRTFSSELVQWHAIGRQWPHRSLSLREFYPSGKERYLDWDFENDVVTNEISVDTRKKLDPEHWKSEVRDDFNCRAFAEDSKQWIGSFCVDRSFSVVSRYSGATIFDLSMPEDLFSNGEYPRIVFDRPGRHFLIIGSKGIMAFAPSFFRPCGSWQCSSLQVTADTMRDDDDGVFRETFHQLNSRAMTATCNKTKRLPGCPNMMAGEELSLTRAALSSNGRWCACLIRSYGPEHSSSSIVRQDDITYKACIGRLSVQPDLQRSIRNVDDFTIISQATEHQAVFIFSQKDEDDRVVFVDIFHSPKIIMLDVDDQGRMSGVSNIPLGMKECLHVYQTRDRKRLVMLERRAVSIFDFQSMSIQERIPYKTDFIELVKQAGYDSNPPHHWWAKRMDHRVVSEDGQTVLFGWDTKSQRSILVTPTTEPDQCEAVLREAEDNFHTFCQLTRDGTCTLFTDMEALFKGRIVIGLFSNKEVRVRHTINVAGDVPILDAFSLDWLHTHHLFYELKDDASEIVVLRLRGDMDALSCTIKDEIKRFSIYGEEACIPDYNRLVNSSGTTSEKVQGLFDRMGSGSVFNHPVSEGISIFQQAFMKGDQAMTEDIPELAKREGFEITGKGVEQDLLTESTKLMSSQHVMRAIDLKTSSQCPLQEQMSMTSEDIFNAKRFAPQRVIQALREDDFVVELSQVDVHVDFLDPLIRRDRGVHLTTIDEVHDWKLTKDPTELSRKWRETHSNDIEEMEEDGNKSTALASVKVVCIDGAALPGSSGLIRHLLLHRGDLDIFKSKAVKWIVEWKWLRIWKSRVIEKFKLHMIFLVFLTTYTILLGESSELVEAPIPIVVSTTILVFINAAYGVWMATGVVRQLKSLTTEGINAGKGDTWGMKYYLLFASKWNLYILLLCYVLVLWIPLFHILSIFLHSCNAVLSAMVAIGVILAYVKVWYYAQPIKKIAVPVLMAYHIYHDCVGVLVSLLIMLFGFSLAIHVMLRSVTNRQEDNQAVEFTATFTDKANVNSKDQDAVESESTIGRIMNANSIDKDVSDAFGSFPKGLLTLFYALFGEFDTEVYGAEHELQSLVIIVFVVYMFLQIIILFNLLISIMGDTFERVKSNEEGHMLMAKARINDSFEASASATEEEIEEIKKMTGRYICALDSTEEQSDDSTPGWWTGKFNMMVAQVQSIVRKSKDQTESVVKDEVKALREEIAATTQDQERRIVAIQDQLHQNATEQASANHTLATAIDLAEARNEQRFQDLSTKMERILALMEHQNGP